MVFIGYESGTKGYMLYDPSVGHLVISRDVIFGENQAWDWTNAASSSVSPVEETENFVVHFQSTVAESTIDQTAENPAVEEEGEDSNDQGGVMGSNEATPSPSNTPSSSQASNVVWATPPSHNSEDTYGGPLRFRTVNDLFDSTDEILDHEYSGVCMLAADEPIGVDEALEEECWMEAMKSELQSI